MTPSGNGFKVYPLPSAYSARGSWKNEVVAHFENLSSVNPVQFPGCKHFLRCLQPPSLPPSKEVKRTQIPELPILSRSLGCSTSARRTGWSLRGTVRHIPQSILRFLLCLVGCPAPE